MIDVSSLSLSVIVNLHSQNHVSQISVVDCQYVVFCCFSIVNYISEIQGFGVFLCLGTLISVLSKLLIQPVQSPHHFSLYDNQLCVISFSPISVMTVLLKLHFVHVFIDGNYFF